MEERFLRVNKIKIAGENRFHGDHFETEGNHGSSKDDYADFWPVLLPLDCEIPKFKFFKHCLVFAISRPFPVGFES